MNDRRPREGGAQHSGRTKGKLNCDMEYWIPACAGMTVFVVQIRAKANFESDSEVRYAERRVEPLEDVILSASVASLEG